MKISNILFLLLIFILFLTSCLKNKDPDNYFLHIDELDNYQIIGLSSINDEEIKYFSHCYHFAFDDLDRITEINYLVEGVISDNDPYFNAAKVIITYSDGYEKRSFLDKNNFIIENSNGVYYNILKYDDEQNTVNLFNYDNHDNLIVDINQVVQYRRKFDKTKRQINTVFFNEKGERVNLNYDYCETSINYDDLGYSLEIRYFDVENKLTENIYGFAILNKKQFLDSNIHEIRFKGIDEQLKEIRDGYAMVREIYNNFYILFEQSYYGIDEELKENKLGFATKQYVYPYMGGGTKINYYNSSNQLIEIETDFKIIRYTYDKQGSIIEISNYNKQRKLIENVLGIATTKFEYNNLINKKQEFEYDINGKKLYDD
ncbi:MAG: hypothetical protein KAS53_09245 [Candidatus Cloacimonetes bacterium]|nr:hypothetical protein [Candidatus Cloacimonadota bacterium]